VKKSWSDHKGNFNIRNDLVKESFIDFMAGNAHSFHGKVSEEFSVPA